MIARPIVRKGIVRILLYSSSPHLLWKYRTIGVTPDQPNKHVLLNGDEKVAE